MKSSALMNPTRVLLLIQSLLLAPPVAFAATGEAVSIGARYRIESTTLGEPRNYLVHTPVGYSASSEKYPVLVLLDGETHFAHTSAAADFLAENGRIPRMLIVGVGNTDRMRDLSPPSPTAQKGSRGDKLLEFIGDELIPEVERTYRTQPYRVIVGHSLGGLFAFYALTERPTLFNAYLAISPSLWWDNETVLKTATTFIADHPTLRADIYMTLGSEDKKMLGGFWKFSALLGEKSGPELRWQIKRSPLETHGSISYLSTYEGLQSLFDGYFLQDAFAFYEQAGVSGLEKHYAKVSARLGYPIPIPGRVLSGVLQGLVQAKRLDEAEILLKQGIELYPELPQAHFEMARIYVLRKKDSEAIAELTKVLTLFPGMQQSRVMLQNLHVDVDKIVPNFELSSRDVSVLVGEYRGDQDTSRIAIENGKLISRSATGVCELKPMGPDRLYCVNVDVELTFTRDRRGRVVSMRVDTVDSHYSRAKM